MTFEEFPIRPQLSGIVDRIIHIKNPSSKVVYKNFPVSHLSLVFNYGDHTYEKSNGEMVLAKRMSVEGFQFAPIEYIPQGFSGIIIFQLNMIAKSMFKELSGPFTIYGNWDLMDVYHYQTKQLSEKLLNERETIDKIQFIEDYLLELIRNNITNPYVSASLKLIHQYKGSILSKDISQKLGYSKRQFERLFTQHVGVTPKKYAQIVQFQNSLKLLHTSSFNLTQLTYESGYFDQSHFIKSFKKYSGMTPENFINHYYKSGNKVSAGVDNCYSNLTYYSG